MAEKATPKLTAKCRSAKGSTVVLDVLDLSAGGCMVDRRAWSARPQDRVLVSLPGLASQPATVVWIEEERAGIAFEQALHEAVLVHLQRLVAA